MIRRLFFALLLFTACHHREEALATESWSTAKTVLTIVNHHWGDVRIYLLHDGVTERIGFVNAASNATFFLPGRYFASGAGFQLRASPMGDPTGFTSEVLIVQPNQIVTWTLETQLPRSSVLIR